VTTELTGDNIDIRQHTDGSRMSENTDVNTSDCATANSNSEFVLLYVSQHQRCCAVLYLVPGASK